MSNLNKKNLVENIYTNIVKTSRNKNFFLKLNVDDTVEGRFDLIILHSFVVFNFFILINDKQSNLPQLLFDHMFSDFDSNLREMGFGDIAVNKRMKQFIKAFYGRISNYSKSLSQFKKLNDSTMLKETVAKNIYKDKGTEIESINLLSKYIISNIDYINDKTLDQNIENYFSFKQLDI
jgi:cytochrome b pre-mRNA-processing protein 3|tara:strand:+ start:18 stop:551 length:534 start_codon:yes stop_codon:yes gene_type:complete